MTIAIKTIPASTRKPGKYFEYDTRLAVRNLPANPQKVLLVGQRLAAGSVAELVPTEIYSDADAKEFFGAGSQLHLMAQAAIRANPYVFLSAIALDDAVAGVAATGSVVITGPATGPGVAHLWIGDQKVEAAVATGDTATDIGSALENASGKIPSLPVTVTALAGTLTLTAKNKGTVGNGVGIAFESTAAGVTGAVTDMSNGASDPDIKKALDAVAAVRYHIVVVPYADSDSVGKLRDHLDFVSGPLEQRGAIGICAVTGPIVSATTLAGSINSGRVMVCALRGSKSLGLEIASAVGSAKAFIEDPAEPLDDWTLTGLCAPPLNDRYTRTEEETLLHNGVTPLNVAPGDKVKIIRAISTYTLDASGIEDPALLDITTITSLDYFRDAVRQRLSLRFPRPKFTECLPKQVITEIVDVMYRCEELEIVKKTDYYKDFVLAEGDGQDATRLNVEIPAAVVPGAHVIAGKINLILDNQ